MRQLDELFNEVEQMFNESDESEIDYVEMSESGIN